MDTARIAALLQPFLGPVFNSCHSEPAKASEEPAVLSAAQLQSISTCIDMLLRWNARINLTAIRDPEEIVLRHFGESLFAARLLLNPALFVSSVSEACPDAGRVVKSLYPESSVSSVVRSSYSVADLGSGAGFPGIPLKLWAPQISLTLIESNHKKTTFLREVIRSLSLTNVNVKNVRAESVIEAFDLVTLRAVEDFPSILSTAAALVAPGGRLGLLIGSAQIDAARASLPHFAWSRPVPIPLSTSRMILAGVEGRIRNIEPE